MHAYDYVFCINSVGHCAVWLCANESRFKCSGSQDEKRQTQLHLKDCIPSTTLRHLWVPLSVSERAGHHTKLSSMLEHRRKESTSRGLISWWWSAASMLSGQPAASLLKAAWRHKHILQPQRHHISLTDVLLLVHRNMDIICHHIRKTEEYNLDFVAIWLIAFVWLKSVLLDFHVIEEHKIEHNYAWKENVNVSKENVIYRS